MLDTNIVIHVLRKQRAALGHLACVSTDALCISAITHGEVLCGFARSPGATAQRAAYRVLLGRIDVLPWDEKAADVYGTFRADLARTGTLSPHDVQIVAHALAVGAVLVTTDQAMLRLPNVVSEDWAQDN